MAGIFQPQLESQVQPEQAIQDTSAATAIGALGDVVGGYFRSTQAPKSGGPSYSQAKLEGFSAELSRLEELRSSGAIPENKFQADLKLAATNVSTVDVPEALQERYRAVSGRDFKAFSYESDEELFQQNQLASDFARTIRPSVTASLEADGTVATPEAVDQAVLNRIEEKTLLENEVEIQRQNRALGRPINPTPVLTNIKSDYQTLLSAVQSAASDNIVEQSEFRSLQLSVSNLIATKYTGLESNPEIKGVIDQMNGLLNDIGKGVSSTPSAVLADTLQVALQGRDFSDSTIAVTRGLLEQNPELFNEKYGTNEAGDTVSDALVSIMQGSSATKPIVDIFNTGTAPERSMVSGSNPSLLSIPGVQENPQAYQQVVDTFSNMATTTDPNRLLGNTEARNSWLTSMNIVGSAVASQNNDYLLGEKLLSAFASNGVVKNLDAVYRTDPQNAAQTNDTLQAGLSAERIRQLNELNNRLNAGVGEGQLVLAGEGGRLQLNSDLITANAASLVGGEAGWFEMRNKIAAAGGLENFLKLPMTTVRGANPDASINVKGNTYFLKDMFNIDFDKVSKLSNNLNMIDTKLNNLEGLATKYQEETNLLRGSTSSNISPEMITGFNVVADDGAFLGAVENASQNLGINSSDLLTAISFETVGTFRPDIKNPGSTATGLIQFLEKTAKGLGTSTAELAQMDRTQQMEYVEKYLRPFKGKMKNLGDVYMAIHWPAGVGKDDNYVMYRKGSENYDKNKGLDVSGDGTVTRGEALQRVRQSAGSGGQGGQVNPSERIVTSEVPPVTTEGATAGSASTPVGGTTSASTVSAGSTVDATATLPEQQQSAAQAAPTEGRQAASGPSTPPEITALIQALGGRKLTEEEVSQLDQYISSLGG